MASDGQVTFGDTVVKETAKKIRKLYNDRILAGFAGSAADSFALFSRFEAKLEQYRGNLERSAVELAKDWRSDRMLRRLEAMLIVMDSRLTYLLSGNGDLIEPDDGIVAIGSGGAYALAAAKALAQHTSSERARDRPGVDGHRRPHLHLFQQHDHDREPVSVHADLPLRKDHHDRRRADPPRHRP